MLQQLRKNLQRRQIKYYCAIIPARQNFLLAAIQCQQHEIQFENFAYGSLTELAQRYQHYNLALAAPNEAITSKTWFFPKHFSTLTIYQKLICNENKLNIQYFDLSLAEQAEASDENLIIGYFLTDHTFLQNYQQHGFHISAIEPSHHLEQRTINKLWQSQALQQFQTHFPEQDVNLAKNLLKLLDRDNYYDATRN